MSKRINKIKKFPGFVRDYLIFKKISEKVQHRFKLAWKNRLPCLNENTDKTSFDRHYVYHTSWAARIVAKTKPSKHTDISSSLFFSTIVSAFIPVDFYDYRPAEIVLDNFTVGHTDLLKLQFADNSIESLSCMHVVEHVGLGRYGDKINPEGDLVAASELQRVLANNGNLLFVVPIGEKRIQYNSHRTYDKMQVIEMFSKLSLKEFSYIPNNASEGNLILNAELPKGSKFWPDGCGCFWFTKEAK